MVVAVCGLIWWCHILDGVMTTCPYATIDNKALLALLSMVPQTGRQTTIRKSLGFLCRDGPPDILDFPIRVATDCFFCWNNMVKWMKEVKVFLSTTTKVLIILSVGKWVRTTSETVQWPWLLFLRKCITCVFLGFIVDHSSICVWSASDQILEPRSPGNEVIYARSHDSAP